MGLKETRIDIICCMLNSRHNKHERSGKKVLSSCSIIVHLVLAMLLVRTSLEHHFLHHLHTDDNKGKSKRPGQLNNNVITDAFPYSCMPGCYVHGNNHAFKFFPSLCDTQLRMVSKSRPRPKNGEYAGQLEGRC